MNIIEMKHISGNASACVEEALGKIIPGEENLIRFEKGIYEFDFEGSRTDVEIECGYLRPSRKHVLFALENLTGLTIDGSGSEFLFLDRMFPFYLLQCRNVALKNFTIDFACSMLTQGTVIASDNCGFELKIDRSLFRYRVDAEGHVIFDCGRSSFSSADNCPILLGNAQGGRPPWDYIFAGSTLADISHLPTGFIWTDAEETPQGIRFRYRKDSKIMIFPIGDELFFNYMPRQNVNIYMQSCKDISLENITLYRGGGMDIVADFSENVSIDGSCIMVRPGRGECRSTTADGMFFSQCSGLVSIRNSKISNTLDDALNIHGFYTHIVSVEGKTVRFKHANASHGKLIPYTCGDKLTISDPETQNCKAIVTVACVKQESDGTSLMQLQEEIPGLKADDIMENETRTADFLFENNEVEGAPHLRISDNGKLRIRNNTFKRIESVYFCDLLAYWYECGAIKDLVVENNEFIDCPSSGEYAITVESSRKNTSDIRNQNIQILNNRFTGGCGKNIRVRMADHVVISGNRCAEKENIEPIETCDCTDVIRR